MNSMMKASLSNLQLLLWIIKEKSPITKRELQEITGFSWGLVSGKVNTLFDANYIVSYSRESFNAGRKAEEFDINHEKNYFIGIDIHYKGIFVILTDMKGRIVEQVEKEFSKVHREYVLQLLFEILDALFKKYGDRGIFGIGIGVQGIVDRENGVSVFANGIEEWTNVPLKQIMETRYHVEVIVEHDPDCIMMAESAFGHLNQTDVTNAMVVTINFSLGIGMSVMINGDIYRGWHGKAGEIGYAIVNDTEEKRGKLLEDHSTKEDVIIDYHKITGDIEDITYGEIVERAYKGDEKCQKVLNKIIRYISIAICSTNNILNPEMIIIHAPTCEFKDKLFESIKKYVVQNSYDKEVQIKFSELGREVRAVGGALSAIEKAICTIV